MIKTLFLYASFILAIASCSISIYLLQQKKSICFVDNGKLYDGFTLKKEYEKQIEKLRMSRKNMLDSIEFSIKQFESRNLENESKFAQEYYMEKAKQFEEDEENLLAEYNQQIWKRLNQYAIDFAKEKNVDILLGASGNGNLLFGNEKIDLTNDLIAYSNKKYNGK